MDKAYLKQFILFFGLMGTIIVITVVVLTRNLNPQKPESSPTPSKKPEELTPGNGFVQPTKKPASKISINDIEHNEEILKQEPTNNRGDILVSDEEYFQTLYFAQEDQFLISVIMSPFNEKRIEAENDFVIRLGISKENACLLDVVITTPKYANPNEAGKNYSLSFCE